MKKILLIISMTAAIFSGLTMFFNEHRYRHPDSELFSPDVVRDQMRSIYVKSRFTDETELYFKTFGFDRIKADHRFGYFIHNSEKISAHLYVPYGADEIVFIFHGYLSHTGYLTDLVSFLTDKGFACAMFDMEGHGLSGGKRADIKSFDDYISAAESFINTNSSNKFRKRHAVAHSAGCTVVISLLAEKNLLFSSVVLISPLVREKHWQAAGYLNHILKPFIESIPRIMTKSSSDKIYMDMKSRKDPLVITRVPLHWKSALDDRAGRIEKFRNTGIPVSIIQGDADTVVDSEHNIQLLKNIFTVKNVYYIKNGGHDLLNESDELKRCVFSHIIESASE